MKSIAFLLLIIGLLMIVSGYFKDKDNCDEKKIEYRYIPRNFSDEQNSTTNLKDLYSDMFTKSEVRSKYPLSDIDISGDQKMLNFIDNYYNIDNSQTN